VLPLRYGTVFESGPRWLSGFCSIAGIAAWRHPLYVSPLIAAHVVGDYSAFFAARAELQSAQPGLTRFG
jgi:hypothetical protein